MKTDLPAPLLFEPLFRSGAGGGREWKALFGKKLPPGQHIGESREIVDRPEAQSVVKQGPWRGQTLHELWRDHRAQIFGEDRMPEAPRFPSSPSSSTRRRNFAPGASRRRDGRLARRRAQSEMWVLRGRRRRRGNLCRPAPGVTREHLEQAIRQGTAADPYTGSR